MRMIWVEYRFGSTVKLGGGNFVTGMCVVFLLSEFIKGVGCFEFVLDDEVPGRVSGAIEFWASALLLLKREIHELVQTQEASEGVVDNED